MTNTALRTLRDRLDRDLRACLAGSTAWQELIRQSPEVFARVDRFVFAAGKRLRPLLFTLLYRAYARRPAPGATQVALALELLHAFVLIHDDIVDRSPLRRVGPTLHRGLAADLELAAHDRVQGEDLALVAGDVLYALALHLYQTADLPPVLREQGMACLTEAALLTGQGELRELLQTLRSPATVSEDELVEIYDLKTAHYTFCCPMVLAATLGEAPAADLPVLREMGLLLGRAYQVSDDLAELAGDDPCGSDLAEKRHTLLLHWGLVRLDAAARGELLAYLAEPTPSPERLAAVQRVLAGSAAELHARRRVDEWLEAARRLLPRLALDDAARSGLGEVVDHIAALGCGARAGGDRAGRPAPSPSAVGCR